MFIILLFCMVSVYGYVYTCEVNASLIRQGICMLRPLFSVVTEETENYYECS